MWVWMFVWVCGERDRDRERDRQRDRHTHTHTLSVCVCGCAYKFLCRTVMFTTSVKECSCMRHVHNEHGISVHMLDILTVSVACLLMCGTCSQ